jgi:hypothetical protein
MFLSPCKDHYGENICVIYESADNKVIEIAMKKRPRSPIDRRSGTDRRKAYQLGYFSKGGIERRSGIERRRRPERRRGWPRASEWPDAGAEAEETGKEDEGE